MVYKYRFAMDVKLPETIASVAVLSKAGAVKFDEQTHRLRWDVGKFVDTFTLEVSLAYKTVNGVVQARWTNRPVFFAVSPCF